MYVIKVRDLKHGTVEEHTFETAKLAEIYKQYHFAFGNWKGRAFWVKEAELKEADRKFVCDEKTEIENKKIVRYYYIADGMTIDAEVVNKTQTAEEASKIFRSKRDEMLFKTDWTQLADVLLTQETRKQYRAYRQYLRDAPALHNDESIIGAEVCSFEEWLEGKR